MLMRQSEVEGCWDLDLETRPIRSQSNVKFAIAKLNHCCEKAFVECVGTVTGRNGGIQRFAVSCRAGRLLLGGTRIARFSHGEQTLRLFESGELGGYCGIKPKRNDT